MDGKPLVSAFIDEPEIRYVNSWENVPGEDGRHPADAQVDSIDAHESLQQLVDLGYIDEVDDDRDKPARRTENRNRFRN